MSHQQRQILAALQSMSPGQRCRVNHRALQHVATHPGYAPEDMILEAIPGSSYEFGYTKDPVGDGVTFWRLPGPLQDGRRSYVSPDRREHYTRDVDGLYRPKEPARNPNPWLP